MQPDNDVKDIIKKEIQSMETLIISKNATKKTVYKATIQLRMLRWFLELLTTSEQKYVPRIHPTVILDPHSGKWLRVIKPKKNVMIYDDIIFSSEQNWKELNRFLKRIKKEQDEGIQP